MTQIRKLNVHGIAFSIPAFVFLVVFVGSDLNAIDDQSIANLKEIQQKTSAVVSKNMASCVAISDGAGFGSGVIVSEDGLVLTAGHVMASPGTYEVILPSGRTVKARPLGKNLSLDAGMIQIVEPGPWPFVKINRDVKLNRGEWVVSLGHSGGFERKRAPPVRTGRILKQSESQVVTDAVLIGGDSGGPLFNLNGELVGIHSSIGDTIAENRHVTMNVFFQDWERMRRGETWGELPDLKEPEAERKRGLIGIRVDLTAPNCRIKLVEDASAASEAGLQADDVVTHLNRVLIRDGQHLIDVVKRMSAGDVCSLRIRRNGTTLRFRFRLR